MRIVRVRFRPRGRAYDFDAGELELRPGLPVVVDTDRGMGVGLVANPVEETSKNRQGLKPVIRVALERDMQRRENMEQRELDALRDVVAEVKERKLPMKVVGVEYFFDASKVIVYFNSEERVDFRNLVKDLIGRFHTRVEMKQIGVRDGARMIGGIGPCGLELCCSKWLQKFDSVSVKSVKTQNLSLNPSNITGVCGKLKCCLNYEINVYEDAKKGLPKQGKRIPTPLGEGKVVGHNIFRRTIFVKVPGMGEKEYPAHELVDEEGKPHDFSPEAVAEREVAAREEARREREAQEPPREARTREEPPPRRDRDKDDRSGRKPDSGDKPKQKAQGGDQPGGGKSRRRRSRRGRGRRGGNKGGGGNPQGGNNRSGGNRGGGKRGGGGGGGNKSGNQ